MAQSESKDVKKAEPWGSGMLMLFGILLLALAAYCFVESVYPGTRVEEWQSEEGKGWYVQLNWGIAAVSAGLAIYTFVLAAKRSKKPAK